MIPGWRDNAPWVALGLLAACAGVWLRFWQIDSQVLIDDEWHAIHRLMFADYRDIFLSFGHADYSIPLTLLFKWMAETIGLSEWRLRGLPMLFGIVTLAITPWLLRPWLRRGDAATLLALLAVSPVLIHFTRFVRPYAIVIALGFLAVIATWRYWQQRDRRWLMASIPATVLCAWLHPLTLMFTVGAYWLPGVLAVREGLHGEGWRPLIALSAAALVSLGGAALLLLPPLLADPAAMASKSGLHGIAPETLWRVWEFWVGSGNIWMCVAAVVPFAVGLRVLARRDGPFTLWWIGLFAMALAVLAVLDAAWSHHAMVVIRYTAVGLPFISLVFAIGLAAIARKLAGLGPESGRSLLAAVLAAGFVATIAAAGPLPTIFDGRNQFTSSMQYHYRYNYDPEANIFVEVLDRAQPPEFYRDIAEAPGSWEVIETPWWFESHYNPLAEYQQVHQRRVRIGMISGLCTDWTHGELRPDDDLNIVFRNFVYLADLLNASDDVNRFVVFHRRSPLGEVRQLPDIDGCIRAFRDRFGSPWHESRDHVVFRIQASASH